MGLCNFKIVHLSTDRVIHMLLGGWREHSAGGMGQAGCFEGHVWTISQFFITIYEKH
jgi:hypothetical protein